MTLRRLLCLPLMLLSLRPTLATAQPALEPGTGQSNLFGQAVDGSTATVNVDTNEPDLVVGVVTSRSIAAGGDFVIAGVGWKEACTAPCSFRTDPGLRTLVLRSPDLMRFHELRLRPGTTDVYLDRGSPGLRSGGTVATSLGVLGLIVGGSFWMTSALLHSGEPDKPRRFTWAPALTLGSAVVTAGGITMIYVGRVRIEERSAQAPQARPERGLMVQAGGVF